MASKYPKPPKPNAAVPVEPCTAKLPKKLSPSRAKDYLQCPRMFFEKTIAKTITFKNTEATTKGTLVHYALEKIFDLPKEDRTPENAVKYIRPHWEELSKKKGYEDLAAMNKDRLEGMQQYCQLPFA